MNARTRNWFIGSGIGMIAIVLAGLLAYASQPETLRWKEEVQLHDGRVTIVARSVTFGGPHEIGQAPSPSRWIVEFQAQGSDRKSIIFESEDGETPIFLDFEKGVPHVAVYLSTGTAEYKYRCPNPPYVFFRFVDKNWQAISLAEFPEKFSTTNLLPFTRIVRERSGTFPNITLAEKEAAVKNNVGLVDHLKRILRPHGNRTVYGQYGCPSRG
jgi:hypothetical protein